LKSSFFGDDVLWHPLQCGDDDDADGDE